MRVVHEPVPDAAGPGSDERDSEVLATTVEVADSLLSRARGLMFRRSIPDDYALAFPFESAETRDLHMLFVRFPIDAVWVVDDVVQRVERLRPWRSVARAEADLILELPAGRGAAIDPGDRLRLEDA
ncbi:hypothetical protein HTG_13285 [Natrinema mahii]|nr:hypothetical protein HTG_13285 [Natrinema mahii]